MLARALRSSTLLRPSNYTRTMSTAAVKKVDLEITSDVSLVLLLSLRTSTVADSLVRSMFSLSALS